MSNITLLRGLLVGVAVALPLSMCELLVGDTAVAGRLCLVDLARRPHLITASDTTVLDAHSTHVALDGTHTHLVIVLQNRLRRVEEVGQRVKVSGEVLPHLDGLELVLLLLRQVLRNVVPDRVGVDALELLEVVLLVQVHQRDLALLALNGRVALVGDEVRRRRHLLLANNIIVAAVHNPLLNAFLNRRRHLLRAHRHLLERELCVEGLVEQRVLRAGPGRDLALQRPVLRGHEPLLLLLDLVLHPTLLPLEGSQRAFDLFGRLGDFLELLFPALVVVFVILVVGAVHELVCKRLVVLVVLGLVLHLLVQEGRLVVEHVLAFLGLFLFLFLGAFFVDLLALFIRITTKNKVLVLALFLALGATLILGTRQELLQELLLFFGPLFLCSFR
eukprot:PhM_4_TR10981/c0_g1_i1/m.81948